MDMATRVQILDEAVCISHSANTLEKVMNPNILLLANSSADWALCLGMTTGLVERKTLLKN